MSKRRQPQRLPPPVMHGEEAIDSEVILTEFPGELGLVLWKSVRSVRLWSELADGERSHAFGESVHARRVERIAEVGAPEEIVPALTKTAAVLQPRARTATVAKACREIAEWAAGQGELGTAIEFMQAGAMVTPADAEIAHEVGRLARTRTEYARAEMWYRQAVSRARKSQDWYEFSRSYIGLGKIFLLRGSYPQAKRNLIRGLRAAKRFSIRPLAARAYHDLMALAIKADRLPDASNYAKAALKTYGAGHSQLPALAHDYGVFLMESGHFGEALRTFLVCPYDPTRSLDQLARAAVVVRAAGNVGRVDLFATTWSEAEALLNLPAAQSVAASALLDMARGAAAMNESDLAAATGERARVAALERAEYAHLQSAEAFLSSLRRGSPVEHAQNFSVETAHESVAVTVDAFESVFTGAVLS